jgi:hypothetical protein
VKVLYGGGGVYGRSRIIYKMGVWALGEYCHDPKSFQVKTFNKNFFKSPNKGSQALKHRFIVL